MSASKRISRILSVYHLCIYCWEFSLKEVMERLPKMTVKTFQRDIKLLKDAGVLKIGYSKNEKVYVPISIEPTEPVLPESRTKRLIILKIRRLCILMQNLYAYNGEEKPLHIELYKELFPNAGVRTRQRDFAELEEIGYICYRSLEYCCNRDKEASFYSFEIPDCYD